MLNNGTDTQKAKTFVSLFYLSTNIHLIKDIGMIPYLFYKKYGYDSYVVTYKCNKKIYDKFAPVAIPILDDSYSYKDNEVLGLKIRFIKYLGVSFKLHLSVAFYLLANSRSINVLYMEHFDLEKALYCVLYKMLNPKGFFYLRMDIDSEAIKEGNTLLFSNNTIKSQILKYIEKIFFKKVDLISIENIKGLKIVRDNYKKHSHKFIYSPYGIDTRRLSEERNKIQTVKKENVILSVGRIGTVQKNTELLLEALEEIKLNNWKVYLVGPIENSFQEYLKEYFERNPLLKDKIIFTGNISNRDALFEYYKKAKIFCLTSRFESFGIVFIEALFFGDYVISTQTAAIDDIIVNERMGRVFHSDKDSLKQILQQTMNDTIIIDGNIEERNKFVCEKYSWDTIVENLYTTITQSR